MYITWQNIITAAAVIAAILAIVGYYNKAFKWYQKQEQQSADIEELRELHRTDMERVNKENTLICYALSACLDGLAQLGANHTVPAAKEKLDKYLNQKAHDQI